MTTLITAAKETNVNDSFPMFNIAAVSDWAQRILYFYFLADQAEPRDNLIKP